MKNTTPANTKPTPLVRLERILPWLLVGLGIVALIASLAITMEKFDLLKNPNYHPICNLNPIISCGSVMESKQANAFGFMNTYIGLIGFPVIITIGMAMQAGARFKRWFWLGLWAGLALGTIFAYWLLFESVYNIGALCPYCLSVDVAITILFWYVSLFVIREGWLRLPAGGSRLKQLVQRHHLDLLVLWFAVVIALVLQHFWYYFGQQL